LKGLIMKKNYIKRLLPFLAFIFVLFLISSCADVTNIDACTDAKPYGFFAGLWHGIIAIFSFIGSLFSKNIAVYAVNNTGGWYDLGFLIGVGAIFGGGGKAT
jgi:lysophospholipid acyltransferase (LPLAT)-like uncharacterized protein